MNASVTIRKISQNEAADLLALSRRTFFDTFYHLNKPEDMEAYASDNFNPERVAAELADPDSEFYFLLFNQAPAGYLKLNFNTAQTEPDHIGSAEIERIYVLADYQGKSLGRRLLQFAIDRAHKGGLKYIWLGVWDQNQNAICFYERHGFKSFSSHPFMLGSDLQTDILMKLDLQTHSTA